MYVCKRQRKFLWVDSESACTMAADTDTFTDTFTDAVKEPTRDTVTHAATDTDTVIDICMYSRYNYRYSYRYSNSLQRFICDCSWRERVLESGMGEESGNRSK